MDAITSPPSKCNGQFSSGKACPFKGKRIGLDGKIYCGFHFPKTENLSDTLNIASCDPPPNRNDIASCDPPPNRNEYHRHILFCVINIFHHILTKSFYTLVLMCTIFVIHLYGKSYFYHNCDSNLLKALLFKKSSTCQMVGSVLQQTEYWFMTNVSIITRYWLLL